MPTKFTVFQVPAVQPTCDAIAQDSHMRAPGRTDSIRRNVILSVAGALITTHMKAVALSPKPPSLDVQLERADLVVVGVVERYIFRGVSRKTNPQEFDRDFDEEGKPGTRAMDVLIRIEQVLLKRSATAPAAARIHWPIPLEQRASTLGSTRVFLLDKGYDYRPPNGSIQHTYQNVTPPLPMDEEKKVREALEKHQR